jgi:hypothetical protein
MSNRSRLIVTLLFAMQAGFLIAQPSDKPKPTFTLAIEEEVEAAQRTSGLHRLLVRLTRVVPGVELEQFHPEAMGMYDMIVLFNGTPAEETVAMRALRNYRKVDRYPTIRNPRAVQTGKTWTTQLDVSDYYDMTRPGAYQITVMRESLPMNLAFSNAVLSNTITIVVPRITNAVSVEKPKPKFSLSVYPSDPDESPVSSIRVELENTSDGVIREAKCWPFMGMYNLFVSRDGQPIAINDAMRGLQKMKADANCPGSETFDEIKPGDKDEDEIPLANFFDVSVPGSYTVYATRGTYPWNVNKSVTVESNLLTFVVSPPPSDDGKPLMDESLN